MFDTNEDIKKDSNQHMPGGKEAVSNGCTCPIIDNHYGAGRNGNGMRYGWFFGEDCPLHN